MPTMLHRIQNLIESIDPLSLEEQRWAIAEAINCTDLGMVAKSFMRAKFGTDYLDALSTAELCAVLQYICKANLLLKAAHSTAGVQNA